MPCPRTQHRNNVPILHQAGFETAQQTTTLVKLDSITIVRATSLMQTLRCCISVSLILCFLNSYRANTLHVTSSLTSTKKWRKASFCYY